MNRVDNSDNVARSNKRILFLFFLFVVSFSLYIYKLFSMQILSGELYKSKAQTISRRTYTIPAQRGEIFDSNYNLPLVLNIDSFAVRIIPAEIPSDRIETTFSLLAELLGISIDQINIKIPPSTYRMYQSIEVMSNVSFEKISCIGERIDELPGVSWQSKPIRNFVDSGSLSHIVGYVGDITKEELKVLYNKGYQAGDVIGKSGIEKQYDEILRGKDGREIRTVDARGRPIADSKDNYIVPPIPGENLVLTIDSSIQNLAEKALGERMGSIVILRPSTGEILAMVSYPWYDPNVFNQSIGGSAYQSLLDDTRKPLLNRSIQSNYPPASTFKIIMSSAILQENAFPPEANIECEGEVFYGDRLFRCHIKKPGHGFLNLKGALAQSCDIYFWTVGRDFLGIENIVLYSREFGLGSSSGIDLPGEISGFIPTPQWKERRFHEKWLDGDTMNLSIGQGYLLATPLQMANIASMIVNEGVIYTPHVLKEVRDPISGSITKSVKPSVYQRSTIDLEVFEVVKENMRAVITEGTAKFPLDINAVQIAGKTGTGEVGLTDRWHSWFVAFAPFEPNPENIQEQIIVSIIVEASNPWEWWAPYAATIIFQGIFSNQDYNQAIDALGFNYLVPERERRE